MQGNGKQKLKATDINGMLNKLPPSAQEVEEAVIAGLLLEKDSINVALGSSLKPEHFYDIRHEYVYQACLDLFSQARPIDMRTVIDQLKKNGKLEMVGGMVAIMEMSRAASGGANIDAHIRIIQEKFMKRELIKVANTLHHEAYDDQKNVFDLIESASTQLFHLDIGRSTQRKILDMITLMNQTIQNIQMKNTKGGLTGIPSGFTLLDRITSGWQKSDLILIAARPGQGKALSLNENILTDLGWIKMRDIKVGMNVCGSDGKFYPVTGVYPQGIRDAYDVKFDDGTIVRCDQDHLWEIQSRKDRKNNLPNRVISLKQMLSEPIILKDKRKNYTVKTIKPVQYIKKDHLIHPYILGVLLGDGSLSKPICYSNPEKDISDKIDRLLPDNYKVSHKTSLEKAIIKKSGKVNLLKSELIRLGLINHRSYEKFIPNEYLYDSIEHRTHLLHGLIDTDGFVDFNYRIEYSTTSERLMYCIKTLVGSLGGKCSVSSRLGSYRKNGMSIKTRINYRLHITFPNDFIPVSSKKHLGKYKPVKQFFKKFITEISYAGQEETQCISVASPDRLFVTNDYTLTHNTAMLLSVARTAAREVPTAIFSLEMSSIQLGERLISADNEIENDKIRSGLLSDAEWHKIASDPKKLSTAKLYLDDTPSISLTELRSKCLRLKQERNIGLVMIDYLQLMTGDKKGNREQEIGSISRGLKNLAKELDIPIIALSQLSRTVETRADKRPMLSDLRESGSLEMDADLVVFLYRPEYYKITADENGNSTAGVCEVDIAKHRNGGTGMCKVKFIKYFTKFVEFDTPDLFPDAARAPKGGFFSKHQYDPSEARNKADEPPPITDENPF